MLLVFTCVSEWSPLVAPGQTAWCVCHITARSPRIQELLHVTGVLAVSGHYVHHQLCAGVLVVPREGPWCTGAVVLHGLIQVLLLARGSVQPRRCPAQLVGKTCRSGVQTQKTCTSVLCSVSYTVCEHTISESGDKLLLHPDKMTAEFSYQLHYC